MIRLIVDAMGGDNGSKIVVDAIKNFLKDHQDVEITVCGKKEELQELDNICKIIDAPDVVPMEAGALEVLRMKNSSMMMALKTMRDEKYDAVVSIGSTGGFLSASTITLKMIPGVKRAALVTAFPTQVKGHKVTLLDIGASNENSPEELVQFALMGKLYCQAVYQIEKPNIYLLSNGKEEEKGSPEVKEAHRLLKEMNFEGFKGNVEGNGILSGDVDVLVTGGYAGNIMLKTTEGVAKMLGGLMSNIFTKNLITKIGYLHVKSGVKEMKEIMDYKSSGGAMLIGVNGVVVKGHGNSDAYSFYHVLRIAKSLAEKDIVNKIKEGLSHE